MVDDFTLPLPLPDPPASTAPAFGDTSKDDPDLVTVHAWFEDRHPKATFGAALRQAFDEVLDGARTGRFDILGADVSKTERTYLGTKIEIVVRSTFDLPPGERMDYRVEGIDVDAKFSIKGSWQIPTEAMGHICLVMSANDKLGKFTVGVVRISAEILNSGQNKDGKKTLSTAGRQTIKWLVANGSLPPNQLLHMDSTVRDAIFAYSSGQRRITELFRQYRGIIVHRNTASTVACQRDPLKRCRDARKPLAREGIVVLGHQNDSPRVAAALGLPTPDKGEFLSVRLVRDPDGTKHPFYAVGDEHYVIAEPNDPHEPAPVINY